MLLKPLHSKSHFVKQINKSISELLARNRARNDASNRAEFLHPSKRLHTSDASDLPSNEGDDKIEHSSCARTDAKTTDRDVMMKFDIAKNEEGPLRRTLTIEVKDENHVPTGESADGNSLVTASRHPGLDERLKTLETHLAMRYGTFVRHAAALNLMRHVQVPSPPASLLHRIKCVEDHIIQLERDYPPWAALHFNQPRRGVRRTLHTLDTAFFVSLIPASGLRHHALRLSSSPHTSHLSQPLTLLALLRAQPHRYPAHTRGKPSTEVRTTKGRASRSSLHRAVLEKLEVQRAIEDLKGQGEHG
jgi:hypothetical protein